MKERKKKIQRKYGKRKEGQKVRGEGKKITRRYTEREVRQRK